MNIEFGGNCKSTGSRDETIKQITDFLETVESEFGTPAIIYATQELYKALIEGNFLKNPVWIRDIFTKPELADKRTWKLWQFAKISGYVDINVFRDHELTF